MLISGPPCMLLWSLSEISSRWHEAAHPFLLLILVYTTSRAFCCQTHQHFLILILRYFLREFYATLKTNLNTYKVPRSTSRPWSTLKFIRLVKPSTQFMHPICRYTFPQLPSLPLQAALFPTRPITSPSFSVLFLGRVHLVAFSASFAHPTGLQGLSSMCASLSFGNLL